MSRRVASSTARAKNASAGSVSPSSRWERPSTLDHVAAERTGRAESMQGDLGVASHRLGPVAAQVRPHVGHHALDRAPVRRALLRRDRLRCSAQRSVAVGPVDRELQRPADGDPRMPLDQFMSLEPLHPAPDGVVSSTSPRRDCRAAPRGAPPCRRRRRPGRGRGRSPASRSPRTTPRRGGGAGISSGSPRRSSDASSSRNNWWYRYHSRRRSSGTTSRLRRCNRSRNSADPVTPTTASQSGPHIRSRIDVCVRKEASAGDTRSRISERR